MNIKNSLKRISIIFFIMIFAFAVKTYATVDLADIDLVNFSLKEGQASKVTFEDKVYLDVDFGITQEEAPAPFVVQVLLVNANTGKYELVTLDVWDNPCIDLADLKEKKGDNFAAGNYTIPAIAINFLQPTQKVFSNTSEMPAVLPVPVTPIVKEFNIGFEVFENEDDLLFSEIKLNKISLAETQNVRVTPNDKVYLKLDLEVDRAVMFKLMQKGIACYVNLCNVETGDVVEGYLDIKDALTNPYIDLSTLETEIEYGEYGIYGLCLNIGESSYLYCISSEVEGTVLLNSEAVFNCVETVEEEPVEEPKEDPKEEVKEETKEEPKVLALVEKETKIKLDATTKNVPEGTELKAEAVKSGKVYEMVEKALENVNKFVLYDINLLSEDAKVQPEGKVKLSLPIPEGYDASKVKVVRITDEGKVIDYETTVKDGFATIETDHFSNYAVVEQKEEVKAEETKTEETAKTETTETRAKDNTPKTGAVGSSFVVVVVFAMIVFVAVIKIRKNQ